MPWRCSTDSGSSRRGGSHELPDRQFGLSTIKIAIFTEADDCTLQRCLHGLVDRHNVHPTLRMLKETGQVLVDTPLNTPRGDHGRALAAVVNHCDRYFGHEGLVAAGHRVVHGGANFSTPLRITADNLEALEELKPLAPLHQPYNLAGIHALEVLRPGLPLIACFDTAFHRTQPEVAQRFALPREWHERGVRRYGFHGLPYDYVAERLREIDPDAAAGRTIVAHLGHGASVCALKDGVSLATSMSFTALGGLPMGTRCGSLDPGVVLHLLHDQGLTFSEVSYPLYERSGMPGGSGISDDMRKLLESGAPEAEEAVELFVYRAVREIAGLVGSLGGVDALVFTGGVGEHAAPIHARIMQGLNWLGVRIDKQQNHTGATRINSTDSRVRVWVIPINEERVIAGHCRRLLAVTNES